MGFGFLPGGEGGGFEDKVTETQTGDAETQLQRIDLPDADGVYNVIGRISAIKKNAADEYAAIKRLEKSIRKAGGSIQQIVDHSDSESFQDLVGGLFSDGDLTLKDGANGLGLYTSEIEGLLNFTSFDVSGLNLNTDPDAGKSIPLLESDGTAHLIYEDTSQSVIIDENLSAGTSDQIVSDEIYSYDTAKKGIAACIDSAGEFHVVYSTGGNAVKYVYTSSGTWQPPETIASYDGFGFSIDTDENNVPYTVFWAVDGEDALKIADRVGGSWSVSQLDTAYNNNIGNVGGDSIGEPNIYVVDSSLMSVGWVNYNGSSFAFSQAEGSPGSFTQSEFSVGIRSVFDQAYDGSQFLIVEPSTSIKIARGTQGGGFTSKSYTAKDSEKREQNCLVVEVSGTLYVASAGASGGSDPYDPLLHKIEVSNLGSASSMTEVGIMGALGEDWKAAANGQYFAATDSGAGDQKVITFDAVNNTLTIDLKYDSGVEVTNA